PPPATIPAAPPPAVASAPPASAPGNGAPHDVAEARTPVADRAAVEPGRLVHCRLVGLHADTPWTAAVKIDLEGKGEEADALRSQPAQVRPAADGCFDLALPPWTATCVSFQARFRADDPFYLDVDVDERAPALPQSRLLANGEYELRVQPAGIATGLVT